MPKGAKTFTRASRRLGQGHTTPGPGPGHAPGGGPLGDSPVLESGSGKGGRGGRDMWERDGSKGFMAMSLNHSGTGMIGYHCTIALYHTTVLLNRPQSLSS